MSPPPTASTSSNRRISGFADYDPAPLLASPSRNNTSNVEVELAIPDLDIFRHDSPLRDGPAYLVSAVRRPPRDESLSDISRHSLTSQRNSSDQSLPSTLRARVSDASASLNSAYTAAQPQSSPSLSSARPQTSASPAPYLLFNRPSTQHTSRVPEVRQIETVTYVPPSRPSSNSNLAISLEDDLQALRALSARLENISNSLLAERRNLTSTASPQVNLSRTRQRDRGDRSSTQTRTASDVSLADSTATLRYMDMDALTDLGNSLRARSSVITANINRLTDRIVGESNLNSHRTNDDGVHVTDDDEDADDDMEMPALIMPSYETSTDNYRIKSSCPFANKNANTFQRIYSTKEQAFAEQYEIALMEGRIDENGLDLKSTDKTHEPQVHLCYCQKPAQPER